MRGRVAEARACDCRRCASSSPSALTITAPIGTSPRSRARPRPRRARDPSAGRPCQSRHHLQASRSMGGKVGGQSEPGSRPADGQGQAAGGRARPSPCASPRRSPMPGLCSRRDAERWIEAGRVAVNGTVLTTPAHVVRPGDKITVDGKPLPQAESAAAVALSQAEGPRDQPQGPARAEDRVRGAAARACRAWSRWGGSTSTPKGFCCSPPTASSRGISSCRAPAGSGAIACGRTAGSPKTRSTSCAKGMTIDGVQYGPVEARIDREQGAQSLADARPCAKARTAR